MHVVPDAGAIPGCEIASEHPNLVPLTGSDPEGQGNQMGFRLVCLPQIPGQGGSTGIELSQGDGPQAVCPSGPLQQPFCG